MMGREDIPSIEMNGGLFAQDKTNGQLLVCPSCKVVLGSVAGVLQCSQCREEWPIIDGIPHFVEDFPYWGEIPLEQMLEVNRLAEAGNWKATLLDSREPTVQGATGMILNLDRANWQWLVDLLPDSRALDIGAGMGTNSHALATHYREVVAVEPVLERIRFMRQRFLQENLRNISIMRSSVWAIPFANETFDLVAMNGVLEWVAGGRNGDPGACQESALREAFRLLRPGGYLYVGIENRFCPGYFIGYPDPHCGLPFVTVLPRPLAQWYARRKGQSGYRNYLYSAAGYNKLLRKAGFSGVDIYVALPSYNHPHFYIPMDGSIFSYYTHTFTSAPNSLTRRLMQAALLRCGLLQHGSYSFAILAKK
jgi:SAM-dependent methyltransferase